MTSHKDFCLEANLMAWRFARDNLAALALWLAALIAGLAGLAALGGPAAAASGIAWGLLWSALMTAALAEHRRSGRRLSRVPFAGLADADVRRFALRTSGWALASMAAAALPPLIAWEVPGEGYAGVIAAGFLGLFLGGSLALRVAMAMLGWLRPDPMGVGEVLMVSWGSFARLGGRIGAAWLPSALGLVGLAAAQGALVQAIGDGAAARAAGLALALVMLALLVFMQLALMGWAVRCNEVLGLWRPASASTES